MLGFEVFACLVLSCGCGVATVDSTNDAMLFGRCQNCDVAEFDEVSMLQTMLQKGGYVRYAANLMNKDGTRRPAAGAGGEEHHEAFHEISQTTDYSDASMIDTMTGYASDAGTMDKMDKSITIINAIDAQSSSKKVPSGFQADHTDTLNISPSLAELAERASKLEHAEQSFSLTNALDTGQLLTEFSDAFPERINPTNYSQPPPGSRLPPTNYSSQTIENNRSNVSDLALPSRNSVPLAYIAIAILFFVFNAYLVCMCASGGGMQQLGEDAVECAECGAGCLEAPFICCVAYSNLRFKTRLLLLLILFFAVCGFALMWDRGLITSQLIGSYIFYILLVVIVLLCAIVAFIELHDRARDSVEPPLDKIHDMHTKIERMENLLKEINPGSVHWGPDNKGKPKGGCC